jgi:hypothetical protein
MQFTISARGKPAALPIQQFIKRNYGEVPLEQIDSFFGFTTHSSLYGGRIWGHTEISAYDIRSMYQMDINLRLPMTNHHVSRQEYEDNIPFFEKYDRPGNSVIITNDDLAHWIRADFPSYRLEASVIKNIKSLKKIDEAAELYDTVILPMSCNNDEKFLLSIENKKIITLFANAGCALTCPSKICYPSISKANKAGDPDLFRCSQELKYRETMGMLDFDLNHLQSLGFDRFKLLRSRTGDMTGF